MSWLDSGIDNKIAGLQEKNYLLLYFCLKLNFFGIHYCRTNSAKVRRALITPPGMYVFSHRILEYHGF